MTQLTLTLNDEVLEKARRYASAHATTVPSLLEEFVERLACRPDAAAAQLQELFESNQRAIDSRAWTRDELHERAA